MRVRVEDGGPCRRILHVEAPVEMVRPEYDKVVAEFTAVARVPGFRKGKAPLKVVESRFASRVAEEVKERLVPQFYRQALEQEKINAVAIVGVQDVNFALSDGVKFTVTVDVAPEFALPKYKKFALKGSEVSVDDAQVDAAMRHLLEDFARYRDVTDRPARAGDLVLIDYAGEADGKPVAGLAPQAVGIAEGKDFWALVGEPEFIPGLAKGLAGMSTGEEKTILVRFPDDYHVEAIKGKEVLYRVRAKGIRERVLPQLDEEFLKRFDVASEPALREKVRTDVLRVAEDNEKARLKNEIARMLLEGTDLEVPASMVEQETSSTIRSMVRRSMMQGATREQIEEHRNDLLSAASRSSKDKVKLSYILSRIADEEKIQVDDQTLDAHIRHMADQYRMTPEQMNAELEKRKAKDQIRSDLRAEQVLDFLLANAKINK